MLELICVRHGRTAWNAARRFQGQADIPLDDEGRAQALATARLLRDVPIDAAVSSDLVRAAETARTILAGRPGVSLRLDRDLREMHVAGWEGRTWEQVREEDPSLPLDGFHRPRNYRPPGGETLEQVAERVAKAVGRIRAEAADGARVLMVSHAGVLHALLGVILGEDACAAHDIIFSPASVTRFALDGPGLGRLTVLNQVAGATS